MGGPFFCWGKRERDEGRPGEVRVIRRSRSAFVVAVIVAALSMALTASTSATASHPFALQEGLFTGESLESAIEEGTGDLGVSVALSSDGNTALVGASRTAWVFTRSGTTWTQQAKLTGADKIGTGEFGASVALSSDGDTALIGGGGDNGDLGAAWVFTRSGTTWTQQAKLTGGEEIGTGRFGHSVALSSDGNDALIGGPGDSDGLGASWVFTRSGTTWNQQAKLTGAAESRGGEFGSGVALSSNGRTALNGGPGDSNGVGAAWVFMRSSKRWSRRSQKLIAAGEIGAGHFGYSVALSGNRGIALIGGPNDGASEGFGDIGAAWTFTRSDKRWSQRGEKLRTGEACQEDTYDFNGFGYSVALSSSGGLALIGDPSACDFDGKASFFSGSGTTWGEPTEVVIRNEEEHPADFGHSVALSSDGATALAGSPEHAHYIGSAWVFVGTPHS
jgi:hypothetical protein